MTTTLKRAWAVARTLDTITNDDEGRALATALRLTAPARPGPPPIRTTGRRLNAREMAYVRAASARGDSDEAIAAALDVPKSTVYNHRLGHLTVRP